MSGLALLNIVIFFCLNHCVGYQKFLMDFKVSTIRLKAVKQYYADQLLALGRELPLACRNDICEVAYAQTKKGYMIWPDILVAQKVELRCPFSFKIPIYSTRNCTINDDGKPVYEEPDANVVCPDAPLVELNQITTEYLLEKRNLTAVYIKFLYEVKEIFTYFRDTPINSEDVANLFNHYFNAFRNIQSNMTKDIAEMFLFVLDTFQEKDMVKYFPEILEDDNYFISLARVFRDLAFNIRRHSTEVIKLQKNHTVLFAMTKTIQLKDTWNIFNGFPVLDINNQTIESPEVSLTLPEINTLNTQQDVGILVFENTSLLQKYYSLNVDNLIQQNNALNSEDFSTDVPLEELVRFENIGALIVTETSEEMSDFLLTFHVYTFKERAAGYFAGCFSSHFNDLYSLWSNDNCTTEHDSHKEGYTTCRCTNKGAHTVFYSDTNCIFDMFMALPMKIRYFNTVYMSFLSAEMCSTPPPDPVRQKYISIEEADLAAFLGFEYKKELEILGNILGSISFVSLIVTVASYTLFRKVRKGSAITILINLCVALLALYVLLFSIQLSAEDITKNGCRATNILRYYLIFVTLFWNAIEAFNMYSKLVKVIGNNISRFALKSGIIAWGLPGVMVALGFAVSRKSFDGSYTVISEKEGICSFRCRLPENTLYYGFLLPMALILIHNLIVFSLIVKVIKNQSNKLGKDDKKNYKNQVVAAVTTLVLLGMPWIFSVFGALDSAVTKLSWLEGTFQVIFVVSLNLQGILIFMFHCARNEQVRQAWKLAIRSSFTSQNTTKNLNRFKGNAKHTSSTQPIASSGGPSQNRIATLSTNASIEMTCNADK